MKSKRIISALLAAVTAVTMTACGNSGSGEPTEKDFEKAAEKLDNMTDEDFEKAAEKAFGEDEPTVDPTKNKETFEPCQEILDADFTSGLIQIGDDVFKCGGYLTVSDLVNQYGDRYNFDDVDLSKKLAAEETEGDFIFDNKTNKVKIRASYCKHGNTLGEAVVYDFEESSSEWRNNTFLPKGIYAKDLMDNKRPNNEKIANIFDTYFNTNAVLDWYDIPKEGEYPDRKEFIYLDAIKKYSTDNGKNNILYCEKTHNGENICYWGNMVTFNAENLFGYKPAVSCVCVYAPFGTGYCVFDYVQYNLYDDSTVYPTKPEID